MVVRPRGPEEDPRGTLPGGWGSELADIMMLWLTQAQAALMGEHYSGDAGRPQHAISMQVYSVALRLRGGVRVLRSVGVVGATSKV